MTKVNHLLGKLHPGEIPPAPRGAPRFEVTFGTNEFLSVSAQDNQTTLTNEKGSSWTVARSILVVTMSS